MAKNPQRCGEQQVRAKSNVRCHRSGAVMASFFPSSLLQICRGMLYVGEALDQPDIKAPEKARPLQRVWLLSR